jgi:polysaccharide deacetylase family protein (PEP-CTERM system associated)
MKNALSFDLEYWHTAELVKKYAPAEKDDQIIEATMPILDLLDKYNTKATFFVLGKVAEDYPDIVKVIHAKGHEIGSHSYSHKMLNELGSSEFEVELNKTTKLLKDITGENPIGFRAPSFSINNSTKWALKILSENGYKYDSSVFPIRTNLYGAPDAPIVPYRPSFDDINKIQADGPLIEFPLSIIKFGTNVPISGGFYFRILPRSIIKKSIEIINNERPVILYLHPWELNLNTPMIRLPIFSRFITYYGINYAFVKLESILKNTRFAPIREVLSL